MPDKRDHKKMEQRRKEPDKESVELKRLEQILFENEPGYKNLFENSLKPVMIVDETGRYVAANKTALDFFECDRNELVGKKIWDFCLPGCSREQQGEHSPSMCRRTLETECLVQGKIKRVLLNVVPLSVSGKKYLYAVGHRAIDRKKTEEEQKPLAGQVRHALKMEACRTLSGGIAHKFNNLLMCIQGYTSLMLIDVDSAHPYFARLKGIEDIVERGADITKQLLGLAGGGKYEVKAIDLSDLIEKTSEMFVGIRQDIKIHRKYQKDIWTAEVDQVQIEQVLSSLYVNAWQAMPGGGDIFIETENVTLHRNYVKPFNVQPGNYVKLSVTDTGIGMDEATRQRIFEPFFTTSDMKCGIGLGLASAYGIIKNHGGIITVHSKKGEGTTFYMYLPTSEKEVTIEKKQPDELSRGTETILVVEDDKRVSLVVDHILRVLEYKIFVATSGREAIEVYKSNKDKIDLVILDMIMPEMDGSEIYDKLKEINPDIRVLLASGYSADKRAAEILERGRNGFIQKPFRIKNLSQKIRDVLDK